MFEVTIWISVVSQVIANVTENIVLVIFFSLGYAAGNVVGILVEKKLTFGISILRVISSTKGLEIAHSVRQTGQAVTLFKGEGLKGPVYELYMALRQKDLKKVLSIVQKEDQDAFFIVEQVKASSKVLLPISTPCLEFKQEVPIQMAKEPIPFPLNSG